MGLFEFMVAIFAISLGCSIPLTVLVGNYKNRSRQLQLAILQEERKMEQIKIELFEKETEKLRLEVENQQLLLQNPRQHTK